LGEVIKFTPKSLIEFEQRALKIVAQSSRLMADMPAAIRTAQTLKQQDVVRRLTELIVPLTALSDAITLIETHAEEIVQAVTPDEDLVIHAANVGPDHTVVCQSIVRKNVIYVSAIEFRRRGWLDRLTAAPPHLLIEYSPSGHAS
jgi:hypothetical protein